VLPGQEVPAADRAAGELLSLPLYPELAEEELQYTIRIVRDFWNRVRHA
jgi:dTDP-4-amino-4,6-dideoxygalactose transaminase